MRVRVYAGACACARAYACLCMRLILARFRIGSCCEHAGSHPPPPDRAALQVASLFSQVGFARTPARLPRHACLPACNMHQREACNVKHATLPQPCHSTDRSAASTSRSPAARPPSHSCSLVRCKAMQEWAAILFVGVHCSSPASLHPSPCLADPEDAKDAESAMLGLDGYKQFGRPIKVRGAKAAPRLPLLPSRCRCCCGSIVASRQQCEAAPHSSLPHYPPLSRSI